MISLIQNKDLLAADVVLVSDTGIIANDIPSITTGLRGLSYVEVKVIGPNRDLHSGLYGGAAPNPINILCDMVASLKDDQQRITVPGFYDKVIELSADEREAMAEAPFSEEEYKASIGIGGTEGEKDYSAPERMSIRPTLDVNGIWGGYTGEGAKTVIASEASAKISMRLVPDQDPDEITHSSRPLRVHLSEELQGGRDHHARWIPGSDPDRPPGIPRSGSRHGGHVWPEAGPFRGGGSIPIVTHFETVLGLKTVLMGFGLDSDAIHSPDEHYGVFNYFKGIETIPHFHARFAEFHAG